MKVTIADIAKMANVSKATVSRVINNRPEGVSEEVRAQILNLIKQVGYQPNMVARSLATSKSKDVALIIPDITNPFFTVLARGVEDYANSMGYTVFICNSDSDTAKEEKYLMSFIEKRVEGIILTSNAHGYPRVSQVRSSLKPPMVLLDRMVENLDCNVLIQGDNVEGGYIATKHLLEQGRTKIAYLTGKKTVEVAQHRLKGYQKALKEFGIPYSKKLIRYGDFTLKAGTAMIDDLLEQGSEFDAVFAGCDLIAMSVIKKLRQIGRRIPEDVAVVGFDNITMSDLFEPALTTVDQYPYEMGRLAAENLLSIIDGKEIMQEKVTINSHLVVRQSSKGDQDL